VLWLTIWRELRLKLPSKRKNNKSAVTMETCSTSSRAPTLEDIVTLSGISEEKIVYAFVYGSRLFGTATEESG
jgi:hypothetical protein